MFSKVFITIFACFALGLVSCHNTSNPPVDCSGITPKYTTDVAAILTTNCASDGCHGNNQTQAGINLTSFDGAKNATANSKFLKAIKHQSGAQSMPPNGLSKLSNENILLIECWIQNGKPE